MIDPPPPPPKKIALDSLVSRLIRCYAIQTYQGGMGTVLSVGEVGLRLSMCHFHVSYFFSPSHPLTFLVKFSTDPPIIASKSTSCRHREIKQTNAIITGLA